MEELFKDELNKEILTLLFISKLPHMEKRLWLATLPEMTVEEKNMLKKNLEEEVEYEKDVEETAIRQFVKAFSAQ